MTRFLFTRRSNFVDVLAACVASSQIAQGDWMVAVIVVLVLLPVSVAGEIYIRENAA